MAADDLAGLFADPPPGPSLDMRYRQGTILSFDPVTLANTVDVGGSTVVDLPILGVGEAALLVPGSVVGIASVLSSKGTASWAIFGRLVTPNTVEAGEATALLNSLVKSASVPDEESTSVTLFYDDLATIGPTVNVNVGSSGRILVIITTQINWTDTDTASGAGGIATIEMSGANVLTALSAVDDLAAITLVQITPGATLFLVNASTAAATFSGLNSGPTTITMKYRSANTASTVSFARRNLVVISL